MTTFLSTTAIDVDPDCRLPVPGFSDYSKFPCANAPQVPASTPDGDLFYVATDGSGGPAVVRGSADRAGDHELSDLVLVIAEQVAQHVLVVLTQPWVGPSHHGRRP